MRSLDQEVDDFLRRYAAALTGFDAQASAELWSTPGMIVDDRSSGVLEDRASMAEGLERSYPLYRALGLASVGYDCLRIDELTPRLRMIHVRWHFHDAAGAELTDSTAYYVVRREVAGGLRAVACLQVDDAEKIRALAAERGVDLGEYWA